jgi:hypothetical protein
MEFIRGGEGGLLFDKAVGSLAGVILISSKIPNNGREM